VPFGPSRRPKTVLGQYTAGTVDGKPLRAYREEDGVAPDSNTPTFVALRAHIDNWRWAGVPFYFRTGKALGSRATELTIMFKEVRDCALRPTRWGE